MQIEGEGYAIRFERDSATVTMSGVLRLGGMQEYNPILELLQQALKEAEEGLKLNITDLQLLNSSGITMLSKFMIGCRNENGKVTVRGSERVPWQGKSLKNLQRLMPTLQLEMV